eukprot:scaffold220200_cov17-Tisochrysis_lutea.AAC.1
MGKELTCKLGSPLVVTAFLLEISAGLASSVVSMLTQDVAFLAMGVRDQAIVGLGLPCANV